MEYSKDQSFCIAASTSYCQHARYLIEAFAHGYAPICRRPHPYHQHMRLAAFLSCHTKHKLIASKQPCRQSVKLNNPRLFILQALASQSNWQQRKSCLASVCTSSVRISYPFPASDRSCGSRVCIGWQRVLWPAGLGSTHSCDCEKGARR
jgi:hypothetical protein